MTGTELMEALEHTGSSRETIEKVFRKANTPLQLDKNAQDVCAAMEIVGVTPNTMKKAKHLAAGKPIADLLGKPPPTSMESREGRLAKELAKELGNTILDAMKQRADDKSPGLLEKPVVNSKRGEPQTIR